MITALSTHQRIAAVITVIALIPCGDLVATLQAATQPAQSTYRSSSSPDPEEARRVVMNLGLGQHVVVRLSSGETVRGHIHEIADDRFVLLLDRTGALAGIAYGEVRQLRPIPQAVPRSRALRQRKGIVIWQIVLVVTLGLASYIVQGCRSSSAC